MNIQQIADEINVDVANLNRITGSETIGYAYPGGFLTDLMYDGAKNHSTIKYARGITSTYNFGLPTDWYNWQPTCSFLDDRAVSLANQFIGTFTMTDTLLYIWGHSFECDLHENGWARLENLLSTIYNGRGAGITRATNGEVYNYITQNRYFAG